MTTNFFEAITSSMLIRGKVVPRCDLEAFSVYKLGFKPHVVTQELSKLVANNVIERERLKVGLQWPTHVYYVGERDAESVEAARKLLEERMKAFPGRRLGVVGEIKARALWKHLQSKAAFPITNVTPKNSVGVQTIESAYRADVRFTFLEASGESYRVWVEVKNLRSRLYAKLSMPILAKLIRASDESDSQPFLMASFLAANTVALCERIGVATYSFERQFMDSKWRSEVKRLYPDTWREHFQFVNLARPMANPKYLDERTKADVTTLTDTGIISRAHATWKRTRPIAIRLANALEAANFNDVDELLGAAA